MMWKERSEKLFLVVTVQLEVNLENLLSIRIFLSLPMTFVEGEFVFSKLNRLKSLTRRLYPLRCTTSHIRCQF